MTALGAVLLVLAPLLLHRFNDALVDYRPGADRLLDRIRDLAARARTFDETEALGALARSEFNGFYHRLDDSLAEAELLREDGTRGAEAAPELLLAIDFADSDSVSLRAQTGSSPEVRDGVLRLACDRDARLQTTEPIAAVAGNVGWIEIRIRQEKGTEFALSWVQGRTVLNTLSIHSGEAAGEFRSYSIDATTFFQNTGRERRVDPEVGSLVIQPTNATGDVVEVDYLRLVSRKRKYLSDPLGLSYEMIDDEMRRVIHSRTPLTIRYETSLPAAPVFLRVGMGILEPDDPIDFKIEVSDEDASEPETLLSVVLDGTDGWSDAKLDLSRWSGKKVRIAFAASSAGGNIAFWSNPVLHSAPEKRRNVLVILEDTLRADHLSVYGYERQTSPFKQERFRDAAVFRNAYSPATKTRPSVPSLMTSLHPTATGVWSFADVLDESYLTLAEVLRSQGFATASFVQNHNAGAGAGLQQGFSFLFDRRKIGSRPDRGLEDALLRWIDENSDRNTFVYLHLVDPHGPYDPPVEYRQWHDRTATGSEVLARNRRHDPDWVERPTRAGRIGLYDGEIARNDSFLRDVVEALEARDLLDETAIVLTSDHGEHLGERGMWEHHPPGFAQAIRVPLIVYFPEMFPGGEIEQPVQVLDVMPTVLEIAGIEAEDLLTAGDSLVSLARSLELEAWESRVVVSEEVVDRARRDVAYGWGSLLHRKWHFLQSGALAWNARNQADFFPDFVFMRVYDVDADPDETSALWSLSGDLLYKRHVAGFLEDLERENRGIRNALARSETQKVRYDPDVFEQLRQLGYIE